MKKEKQNKKREALDLDTRTNYQCQLQLCSYGNTEMNSKQMGNSKACLSSSSLLGSSVSFIGRVYQMFSKREVRLRIAAQKHREYVVAETQVLNN